MSFQFLILFSGSLCVHSQVWCLNHSIPTGSFVEQVLRGTLENDANLQNLAPSSPCINLSMHSEKKTYEQLISHPKLGT